MVAIGGRQLRRAADRLTGLFPAREALPLTALAALRLYWSWQAGLPGVSAERAAGAIDFATKVALDRRAVQ